MTMIIDKKYDMIIDNIFDLMLSIDARSSYRVLSARTKI